MARRDTVDQPPADPGLPFKRRARRRLVGALVIGLGVAIILPFVLDREPRYPRPDIRVDIPSRDAQLPVRVQNEADAAASSAQRPPVSAEAARAARAEAGRVAESRDGSPAAGAAPDASQAAAEARQQARAPMVQQLEPPPDAPPGSARAPAAPRPDPDAARAAAAKAEAARLEAQRQEAARAEAAKASAARAEAARASALGLRAYSETLQTAQGDRVRVRAGPFATRAAAEEARSRLIAAGLEAALIAPEAPR